MEETRPIGKHFYRVESDIIFTEQHGAMTYEEAEQLIQIYEKVHAEHSYILLLIDLHHATTVDIKARRFIVEWNKTHYMAGLAGYGGSLVARAMVSLISGAARLVTRRVPAVAFFKEEAAARAWLAQRRTVAQANRRRPLPMDSPNPDDPGTSR